MSRALAAEITCDGPAFTEKQIETIVARERFVRSDLPKEPPQYTKTLRRQRCHYVYVETPAGAGAHDEITFILDQYGVIVDTAVGRGSIGPALDCPKRKLTDAEIKDFVAEARARYKDLPPPPPKFTAAVFQRRCMYVYVEQPEDKSQPSVSFTLDPYGAVYSAYKNAP